MNETPEMTRPILFKNVPFSGLFKEYPTDQSVWMKYRTAIIHGQTVNAHISYAVWHRFDDDTTVYVEAL